jgi:hypothetical protein
MDTERLISTLAADGGYREPPVRRRLAAALALAWPLALAMLLISLGLRPDIAAAIGNPLFALKFAVTLALAGAAIVLALQLSRPGATLRHGWLLLIPVLLLALGIGGEMLLPQRAPMLTRLVGNNSMLCLGTIPLLSLPLLAAALIGLRQGATTRPVLLGALAGLAAAGLAATLYAAHCADDSPLFVATWYSLAAALVAGLGALAGSRLLRF